MWGLVCVVVVLVVGVVFFFVWDVVGVGLGIFFCGDFLLFIGV